jgi:hypothetical protein
MFSSVVYQVSRDYDQTSSDNFGFDRMFVVEVGGCCEVSVRDRLRGQGISIR